MKSIVDRGVPKVLEPGGDVHVHQEVVRQEDGGRRESHKGQCRLTGIFTQIFFSHFSDRIDFFPLIYDISVKNVKLIIWFIFLAYAIKGT